MNVIISRLKRNGNYIYYLL